MSKIPASTSVEEELLARIKLIAQVDRRSVAEVIAWCAELGLPLVEAELQSRCDELARLQVIAKANVKSAPRRDGKEGNSKARGK